MTGSPYYVSWIQVPEYLTTFSFSCKYSIPKRNDKTVAYISITKKISKGLLVVVFSSSIRKTCHSRSSLLYSLLRNDLCCLDMAFQSYKISFYIVKLKSRMIVTCWGLSHGICVSQTILAAWYRGIFTSIKIDISNFSQSCICGRIAWLRVVHFICRMFCTRSVSS